MRPSVLAAALVSIVSVLGAATLQPAPIERRLYVTNATGISVYDIDRGHAFVRKIDIPTLERAAAG